MGALLNFAQTQEVETCYKCGVAFSMPSSMVRRKHDVGGDFWCPNGHVQHYAETEVARLRKQLEDKERRLLAESKRAETNYKLREKAERKLRKTERRISGGACPCCNRSFTNLRRHMDTKHPEYVTEHSTNPE